MEILGFLFILIIMIIVTVYTVISLVFGGIDLQPLGFIYWILAALILAAIWYALFSIAPFTVIVN